MRKTYGAQVTDRVAKKKRNGLILNHKHYYDKQTVTLVFECEVLLLYYFLNVRCYYYIFMNAL
jgi:hypothetical protein